MKKVLFICTGNTCRSPMAAALGNALAGRMGLELECESAGLAAEEGVPASPQAVAVTAEKGIDLSKHRARQVTPELLESAAAVFVMTPGHREWLRAAYPPAAEKIRLLSEEPVADPYGGSVEEYRRCAEQMEKAILRRFQEGKREGNDHGNPDGERE